jgi:hypothetical protein
VTVYVPGHAKRPHDWFDKARAWLSARLPRRQWTELDDDGQDIADIFDDSNDLTVAGKCESCWAENDGEGCDWASCGCDCHDDDHYEDWDEPSEDVPGAAEPLPGPGHFHDDQPTVVVPAVQLSDGSYAGLSGTITTADLIDAAIDLGFGAAWDLDQPDLPRPAPPGLEARAGGPGQPHRWPRPEPHAGPAAWHPARPPLQPWIQAILGAPTVDAWAWGWQQKQRLAITI